MDLLANYISDEDVEDKEIVSIYKNLKEIDKDNLKKEKQKKMNELMLKNNFVKKNNIDIKHLTGKIQIHHIDDISFNEKFYNQSKKSNDTKSKKIKREIFTKNLKSKRIVNNNPEDDTFTGPWGVYEGEEKYDIINKKEEAIIFESEDFYLKNESQAKFPGEMDPNFSKKTAHGVKNEKEKTSTVLHIKTTRDYIGRSFLTPKIARKSENKPDKPPKKLKKIFLGHQKGIQKAAFFPKTGHLILSASFDKKIKIWNLNGKCIRTYKGHTEAVKDISFNPDGTSFLSAGFDSRIRLWDTETGKPINTFNVQKMPYCVRMNPDPDRQYLFLNASLNTDIEQYDIRTGKMVMSYTDHMEAVNNLLFVEDNKKFISFGDDKKIFCYEFGVPVIIKNICDDLLPAIHSTAMHPGKEFFVAQTSANKICVFDVKDQNLRWNRKKFFKGHLATGYGIDLDFSRNGDFVVSGDDKGKVFFWSWKSNNVVKVLDAHDKVCKGVVWHPLEASCMLTYSWDGSIKLWN